MKILGLTGDPNHGTSGFIVEVSMDEVAGLAGLDYEQRKKLRIGHTIDVKKLVSAVAAVKGIGTSLAYHIEHTEAAFRGARDGVKAIQDGVLGGPEA